MRYSGLLFIALLIMLAACDTEEVAVTPTSPPLPEQTLTPVEVAPSPTAALTETPSQTPTGSPTATLPPSETPTHPPTLPPTLTATSTNPPTTTPLTPSATATLRPVISMTLPPVPEGQGGGITLLSTSVSTATAAPAVTEISQNSQPPISAAGSNPQINPIPLAPVVDAASLPITPLNSDFEGNQTTQGAVEINVPEGWAAWWREGALDCTLYETLPTDGQCPLLADPSATYKRPEFTLMNAGQAEFSSRVLDGQAVRFFCSYGVCVAGYVQRVQVTPGTAYSLSAWAYSWCNEASTINVSQLASRDDQLNCEVAVGLDPTGGLDPFSPAIVWGAANIYDRYGFITTPPVTATGNVMTLYLRGRSLWGLRHNDFHFDQIAFNPA